jgi:tetratricopeptide (TPR) repeat protein
MDEALAIYDAKKHATLTLTLGVDLAVGAYGYSSWSLQFLGYPEQAAARAEAGVEHARTLAHPYSLAWMLFLASASYMHQREWDRCLRHAEEGIEISERHGLSLMLAFSKLARAFVLACTRGEDTIAAATQALHDAAGTGNQAGAPIILWTLVRIHQEMGRKVDALGTLETALSISAQSRQPAYDAELLRLKGELLLSKNEGEAESLLRRALDVARGQEAKLFELRAAMSLARLWQKQGKQDDARALFAPIYNWFTEGFDTLDLREAKALLEELS